MVVEALDEVVVRQVRRILGDCTKGLRSGLVAHGRSEAESVRSHKRPGDYDRTMPQHQKGVQERIVTAEEYARGYFERDGMVVRRRQYELIRRLPDGTYLVRAPEPAKK
jgi:hypothetical protein